MIIFLYVGLVIISVFVILKVISTAISLIFGAPSIDSPKNIIKEAFKIANLKSGEKLYDLGCNNGKVLKTAVRDFGAYAYGLEIAPLPYLLAKINCFGQKKINIKMMNLFKVDLSDTDVIYCYLLPGLMKKLSQKFSKELKPGARVISHGFFLPDKKPLKTIQTGRNKLYLYRY